MQENLNKDEDFLCSENCTLKNTLFFHVLVYISLGAHSHSTPSKKSNKNKQFLQSVWLRVFVAIP